VTLDLLVVGLVLFFALLGALAGGLMQLSHWLGLFAAGLVARSAGLHLGPVVAQRLAAPEIVGVLGATVLCFFTVYILVQVATRKAIQKLTQHRVLGGLDRVLGFVLGGARAAVILYVLLSAMIFFEKPFAAVTHYQFNTRGSQIAELVRGHDLFTRFTFPGTRGLTALARAAQDPAAAAQLAQDPEVQALTREPRVQGLLRDGELQRALQSGDAISLLRDNRVLAVLTDAKLQDRLAAVGDHLAELPPPAPHGKRR
jgi:membrane protein required for colicin V production